MTISKEKASFIRGIARDDGVIEPSEVVDAARSPRSPIHDDFLWDDTAAANAHRIEQARRLIRLVKIEVVVEDIVFSAVNYVSDPNRQPHSRSYLDLVVAATRPETAEAILVAELSRIASQLRRIRSIAAVMGMEGRMQELLGEVMRVHAEAQRRKERRERTETKRRGRPRKTPASEQPRARARQTRPAETA